MTAEAERLLRPLEHLAMATYLMPGVAALLSVATPSRRADGEAGFGDDLCRLVAEVVRCGTRALEAAAISLDCWIADGVAYPSCWRITTPATIRGESSRTSRRPRACGALDVPVRVT